MSIKHDLMNGVFWGALQKYTGVVIQLLISAILARLLSPNDFGVIAISTVMIAFFSMFSDMGIGTAIVQNKKLTSEDLDSIFSFTVFSGLILSVIFFGCSNAVAFFYGNELLKPICRILSLNLLFASLNIVPNALILKEKRFKFIAIRSFVLHVLCGILAVLAAYNGFGVYALLIAPVVTSISVFFINFRENPRNLVFKIDWGALKKIYSFSVFQFLFSFLNYFSRNIDKLIVGRFFSLKDLGYYEKSYRLMLMPLDYVTFLLSSVMHPVLSSLQDNYAELAGKYNKIINFLAFFSFTIGAFCFFAAADLILFVFGDQWGPAVPVFKIFSISLPLQMLLSTTGSIYQSAGKTNWMFFNGLSNTFCTVSGYLIATFCFGTLKSIAWAWDITLLINTIVSFIILYRVVLNASVMDFLKQLVAPFCSGLTLVLLLTAVNLVKPEMLHIYNILIYGVIFAIVLGVSLQLSGVVDVKKFISERIKK